MRGVILISAGGTGGHLFPAEALALALRARGWAIHLATDHRVDSHAARVSGERDPHRSIGDHHAFAGRPGAGDRPARPRPACRRAD